MTDLIWICTSKVDITDPTRICSKYDSMADLTEISDNDIYMTVSHVRGTMLTSKEDRALQRQGLSSQSMQTVTAQGLRRYADKRTIAG